MEHGAQFDQTTPSTDGADTAASAARTSVAAKGKAPARRAKRVIEDRRIPLDLASFDRPTQLALLKYAKSARATEMTLPSAVRYITTRALNDAPPIDQLRGSVEALQSAMAPVPSTIQFLVDEWNKERAERDAQIADLTAALSESRAENSKAIADMKALIELSIRQHKDGFNEFGGEVGKAFQVYGDRLSGIELKSQQANARMVDALNNVLRVLAEAEAERAAPHFTESQAEQMSRMIQVMVADGIKKYLTAHAKAIQAGHANAGSPFNPAPPARS